MGPHISRIPKIILITMVYPEPELRDSFLFLSNDEHSRILLIRLPFILDAET